MADKLSNLTQATSAAASDLVYMVVGSDSRRMTLADFFANTPAKFKDTNFRVVDDGDTTKKVGLQVSAISTSTTRILTVPDQNVDLTPNSGTYPAKTNTLAAGSGLTGGGDLSGNRTLALDAGNSRNVDHSAVSVTGGAGLTGGGDLTASRTLTLDTGNSRNADHSAINVLPGSGLVGGGNLTASRTLSLSVEQATDHTLLPGATIVASFIYDTRQDSDGGAWRHKVNHLSWAQEDRPLGVWLDAQADESAARNAGGGDEDYYYDETNADFRKLTGSSGTSWIDRGARQGFPQVAYITAEANRVVIWDGDDPDAAMWMVFTRGGVIGPDGGDLNMLGDFFDTITDLHAAQGIFFITKTNSNNRGCVTYVDFTQDDGKNFTSVTSWKNGTYRSTISERNDKKGLIRFTQPELVSNQINAVAATVLPQTPPDPNRLGLPTPTVIPFTDGGLSHIASDGSVYDVTRTGGYVDGWIDGDLIYAVAADGDVSIGPIPFADTSDSAWRDTELVQASAPAVLGDVAAMVRRSYGSPGGLTLTDYDSVQPANSGVAHVTKDYNTGWQYGDIRLVLASADTTNVSNGDTEPDRSVKGNDATVNGSLTKSPVASGADVVAWSGFSGSNYLEVPYTSDLDFGTGDFAISIWELIDDSSANNPLFTRSKTDGSGAKINVWVQGGSGIAIFKIDDATNVVSADSTAVVDTGIYTNLILVKRGGTIEIWINGCLSSTAGASSVGSLDSTDAVLRVGSWSSISGGAFQASIALPRITAYAPTPQRIKTAYEQERRLFEPDAKALLGGTSNNVRDLAYEPDGDRLIAATGDGTSIFHGLERTAHYATGDTAVAAAGPNGRLLLDARAIADSRNVERLIEEQRPVPVHDPSRFRVQGRTTDATADVAIGHVPVQEGERLTITARVQAVRGASASYQVLAYVVRLIGLDAEVFGVSTTPIFEIDSGLDATVRADPGSQTAEIAVTGLASTTIGWTASVEVTRDV